MENTAQALQLVLCCDGTNNNLTGRHQDTNVVKLCELLAQVPDAQRLLYYDPGVGNPDDLPGASIADSLKRRLNRMAGLAFGQGVYENIADCYRFLMHHYPPTREPGVPAPEIYVLGFSRGAFTARAVAGLVNQFGLLQPQMDSMVTTLVHAYFSQRREGDTHLKEIAEQIRLLFGTTPWPVPLQFVGVWDTVAAVGMPPFTTRFTAEPRAAGKAFVHVRQALALDEQRAQFRPRLYVDANGLYATRMGTVGSIEQRWFRGMHCDVGGGLRCQDSALSDQALGWLASEAALCGLRLVLDGQVLDTPEKVAAALQQCLPGEPPQALRRVHSQTWSEPFWALSGLAVRPSRGAATEHPGVAQPPMSLAQDSVWGLRRPGKGLLLGAALMLPLLWAWMGWLLSGHGTSFDTLVQAPLALARWQLTAALSSAGVARPEFGAACWALAWDLPFIAAYAYVLAWFATSGFARLAGLRRAGQAAPSWLNRLGLALPLAVLADVLEDLLSAATLYLAHAGYPWAAWVFAVCMAAAFLAKCIGLAGAAVMSLGALRPLR